MNILFIIGNGFDINLNLNTRFSDFCKYYQTTESTSTTVSKLKKSISINIESWADLEKELGIYTEQMTSTGELDEVYADIVNHLGEYLEKEESKLDITKIQISKFVADLYYPEKHLQKADKDDITNYKKKWESIHWNVQILTLNYTTTLEKIFYEENRKYISNLIHGSYQVKFKGIEHLHGLLNNDIILGVNDISQIKNSAFHGSEEAIETLVKIQGIKAAKTTVDTLFLNEINSANLICIFGSSLGETDKLWWDRIAQRLRNDCRLIIFQKVDVVNSRLSHITYARLIRRLKKRFLDMTSLSNEEKDMVMNNILVSYNTGIFSHFS